MPSYGFFLNNSKTWTGDAETITDAIAAAETETGAKVLVGRGLDHYTEPTAADRFDRRRWPRVRDDPGTDADGEP